MRGGLDRHTDNYTYCNHNHEVTTMAKFSNGPTERTPTPTPPPEPDIAEVGARVYGDAPASGYNVVTTGVNESYRHPSPYSAPPSPHADHEGVLGQVTEVTDDEAETIGRRIYPTPTGRMSPASLDETARRMYGA